MMPSAARSLLAVQCVQSSRSTRCCCIGNDAWQTHGELYLYLACLYLATPIATAPIIELSFYWAQG